MQYVFYFKWLLAYFNRACLKSKYLKKIQYSIECLIQASFGVQRPVFEIMFGAMVSFEWVSHPWEAIFEIMALLKTMMSKSFADYNSSALCH